MPTLTVGQAVVQALLAHDVDTLFGLVAHPLLPLYDALYQVRDRLNYIGGRNEQAVAHMADGYARATGRPGVLVTGPGPGAAHAVGGLGEAWASSVPLLHISGAVPPALRGRGLRQEDGDQSGMLASVAGWHTLCGAPEEVPLAVGEAFRRFHTTRPAPAVVEVPWDLLAREATLEVPAPREPLRRTPPPGLVEEAARILRKARRPAIWAGGGVVWSGAVQEVASLAEALGAPVATTPSARGVLPDDHPLSLGCGWAGYAFGENPVHPFLASCDALLVVGSRLDYRATVEAGLRLPSRLVQVDIDPSVFGRNYPCAVALEGDAREALGALLSLVEGSGASEAYAREVQALRKEARASLVAQRPHHQRVLDALREALPQEAVTVWDPTSLGYWAVRGFPVYAPRTFLFPHGWETVGFAFPAGIGARAGLHNRPLVVMTGDGGLQFHLQELGTVMQHGLPLVVVVWNDGAWGTLKEEQALQMDHRFFGTEIPSPDFVDLAGAYNLPATRVLTLEELQRALESALSRPEFHLIEVYLPGGLEAFAE